MLHYETIDPETLGLLKKLQNTSAFKNFRLAGGTALALQIGHRKSIDIDLFGNFDADELEITAALKSAGSVTTLKKSPNIRITLVNGIKTDIVNYNYPWLQEAITENGITLAGEKDIAAMKLAAITGRGSKKDFIDLYFLLKKFSIREMLDLYLQKYHDGSELLVLKSLSWFRDAESDEEPLMLQPVEWKEIREYIASEVSRM